MKDLKEMANNFNPTEIKKPDDVLIDDFAKNIINQVFSQLSVIFPAWKHAWPTEKELSAAKMEWTKAFNENGIHELEQIKYGFKKARSSESDFLPSCGKFISWCTPTAEDLGYPSEHKALQACISYKSHKNMFGDQGVYTRPFIVELYKRVDWWLMNNAGSQIEHKKAEKHFKEEYMALINSGYQEPEETTHERLETSETVRDRMSPEQVKDGQDRGLDAIKAMRRKFEESKHIKK